MQTIKITDVKTINDKACTVFSISFYFKDSHIQMKVERDTDLITDWVIFANG